MKSNAKKITLLALTATVMLTNCRKAEKTNPNQESTSNIESSVDNLKQDDILSKITVVDGMFNFKDKAELIDAACYLTNLKNEKEKLTAYYDKIGFKSLEYKYDLIDLKNDEAAQKIENKNSKLAVKSTEFTTNIALYKKQPIDNNEIMYIRNIDWQCLSFVLNENAELMINKIKYHLQDGKLFSENNTAYKIFDYIESNNNNKTIADGINKTTYCWYGVLPGSIYKSGYGPGTGGSPNYQGYSVFQIAYTLLNATPCNYTYKIVMTSYGQVQKTSFFGSSNNHMYHSGNFTTNLQPGKVMSVQGANNYWWQFYGTSSTVVPINTTIVANDPTAFYGSFVGSTSNGVVRFTSGNAAFTYAGGCCGAGVYHTYSN
jgi:hypothetical protein